MRLCPHINYRVIDTIREPKYSTDEILISIARIDPNIEHYIIKFTNCNQYPDWFYMSGKRIRRYHTQKNGRGEMYVVPMSVREPFEPIRNCPHQY